MACSFLTLLYTTFQIHEQSFIFNFWMPMILPWNIIKSSSLCWLCLYPVMLFTPRKYYNINVLSSFFVIGISSLCKKYICIIYLHYRYFLFCLLKKLSYLRYGMTTLFSVIASSNIWIWLKKIFCHSFNIWIIAVMELLLFYRVFIQDDCIIVKAFYFIRIQCRPHANSLLEY